MYLSVFKIMHMVRLEILAVLCLAALNQGMAYNSIFSLEGMGLEMSPYSIREAGMGHAGMASIRKLGASIRNPSKTGFNTRTTFETVFTSDLVYVQDNATSNTLGAARIPFIGMSFQAGRLGHLGFHYFQRYEKDYEYEPQQTSVDRSEIMKYQAGGYEVIISYAKAVGNLALGLSYHALLGKHRKISETSFSPTEFEDFYGDTSVAFTNLEGDTTVTNWSGWYPAFSVTYKYKSLGCALMFNLGGKYTAEQERRIYQVASETPGKAEHTPPSAVSLGLSYNPSPKHTLVADVSTTDWDKTLDKNIERSYQMGLGYEYQGRGGQYDSYFTRMAYRTGAGYERLYVLDVNVLKLTAGLGFPLGKRGSSMDLALELGRRGSLEDLKVREDYFRVYISLMGAGIWGSPSRSK
jgi:long-chain fatty acid transport protein